MPCLIECEAYYQKNPGARPESTAHTCEPYGDTLLSYRDPMRDLERLESCGSGTWEGVKDMPQLLASYVQMAESLGDAFRERTQANRARIQQLDKNREELARMMLNSSAKKPSGEYVVDDAQALAAVDKQDVMSAYDLANHQQANLARSCQGQLALINRDIQSADGFAEWDLKALQERYRRVAAWDAGCPKALGLARPMELGKAVPPVDWLKSLNIKLQCYPREKVNELMCYGAAQFALQALGGSAEVLAAKAMAKAGIQTALEKHMAIAAAARVRDREAVGAASEVNELADGPTDVDRRTPEVKPRKVRESVRTKKRNKYIDENLEQEATTPIENQEWKTMAENEGAKGVRWFEIENSIMKWLNDNLRDKILVTAMTNRYKLIAREEIEAVLKANPGLEVARYSDFKSIRFAFKGKIPRDLPEQLNAAFRRANRKFNFELKDHQLIRSQDIARRWFRAGYGSTADEASAAARIARSQTRGNHFRDASDSFVRGQLQHQLEHAEDLRVGIEAKWGNSNLMSGEPGTRVPSRETFEMVRSAKSPEELAKAVQNTGLHEFSTSDAETLIKYAKATDSYSPSLRIVDRDVHNLDTAVHGGFTSDFNGLGAGNSHATAQALAGKRDIHAALKASRQGEHDMTGELKGRKELYHKAVGDIAKCSGDDCVGLPDKPLTTNDKVKILENLAAHDDTRLIRTAFIRDGIPVASDRTMLATHGEAIEKALRKELRDVLPYSRTRELTFGVDMQGTAVNQGNVDVLIASKPGTTLTADEAGKIREALSRAVQKVNEDLGKDGSPGHYVTGL
jgi:hypothetical protein